MYVSIGFPLRTIAKMIFRRERLMFKLLSILLSVNDMIGGVST